LGLDTVFCWVFGGKNFSVGDRSGRIGRIRRGRLRRRLWTRWGGVQNDAAVGLARLGGGGAEPLLHLGVIDEAGLLEDGSAAVEDDEIGDSADLEAG
jgi:hypothetical protein